VPSVLIVDDEPNIRRMVGALLSAEGYDVREAEDGTKGLASAEQEEPDVVLLDLLMPGALDGMATLTKLREAHPDIPVVMMSGRAGLGDAVRATRLGAFNFLEKPLTPESVPGGAWHRRPDGREQPANAGGARVDRSCGADRFACAHHRRIGHGEGAGRGRYPRREQASRPCIHPRELRRHPARSGGK